MTTSIQDQKILEQNILSALLTTEGKEAPSVMADVKPEYFRYKEHRIIFTAIRELFAAGQQVDLVSVSEQLLKDGKLDLVGGRAHVTDIYLSNPGTNDHLSSTHVDFLIERYKGFEMTRLTDELQKQIEGEMPADLLIATCQSYLTKVNELRRADKPKAVGELVHEIDDHLKEVKELGGIPGVNSGYSGVDDLTNGYRAGQFVIIAGRPGNCKTTLALNIAYNVARIYKQPALFYSLEMSNLELSMRLMALVAQVNFQKILRGELTPSDKYKLETAKEVIATLPLYLADSTNVSIYTFKSHLEEAKRKGRPYATAIIDYIQLMQMRKRKDENRNLEVTEVSQGLKRLAREEKIPIIALSQLSREVERRQDKRPILSDLRDSGSLEQDADLVFGLYREEYYNKNTDQRGILEVNLLKNRHGDIGMVPLLFDNSKCSLANRGY